MTVRFEDRGALKGVRRTRDGFLIAEAFVARQGVQLYTGDEVGKPGVPTVRVYRPEDEVTRVKSVQDYSHAPITLGHPSENVTQDNWASLAKGEVSTEATWQDGKLRLPLIVKDAAAIQAVESGFARELSAGYTCELVDQAGVTDAGEPYDMVQSNIQINHLALVPKGRAGSECRIGDSDWGAAPVNIGDSTKEGLMPADTKLVVLGDAGVQVPLADAQVIEDHKKAQAKAMADAQSLHDKAMGTKDAEITDLKAKLAHAEAKVLSDEQLDARVAVRAALVTDARRVAPTVATKGLSDAAIRKATVVAKMDAAAVAGKSDDYIEALFDGLVKNAPAATGREPDPVLAAVGDAAPTGDRRELADKAYNDSLRNMQDAWKTPAASAKH